MNFILKIILICTFISQIVIAQNLPIFNQSVLVGVGYAEVKESKPKAIKVAKENAMADLANQIQSNITSQFIYNLTEISNSVNEYTSSKVNLISNLQISGVRWQVDEGSNLITGKAILDKKKGAELYFQKLNLKKNEIDSRMKRIKDLINDGNNQKALKELFSVSQIFNEYEQDVLIYLVIGGIKDEKLSPKFSRVDIDKDIFNLTELKFNNFDDVINGLCFQIASQINPNKEIKISSANYMDTDWGSEFSDYLVEQIKFGLPKFLKLQNKIYVNEKFNKDSSNVGNNITGNYWIKKQNVELLTTIYDDNGIATGSVKILFPLKYLDDLGVNIKPQNFTDLMSNKKYFAKDEIIYGDLKIDFWTNKGNTNLLFHKGEILKLYIRVNEPAYLRFIYHLVNGARTPLYENYYIDETKVNKTVELPDEFECTPPFGVERLQIFASTNPFPKLGTINKEFDGVEYKVLVEDLNKFITKTRGFLKKKNKETKSAERVVTITTVEK